MIATRLVLKNWRNFRDVDVPLSERTYLLGANASGKSNFDDCELLRQIGECAAAVDSVSKCRFELIRRDGVPLAQLAALEVKFVLRN